MNIKTNKHEPKTTGRKKWILLPTDQVPPGVFPSEDEFDVTT